MYQRILAWMERHVAITAILAMLMLSIPAIIYTALGDNHDTSYCSVHCMAP